MGTVNMQDIGARNIDEKINEVNEKLNDSFTVMCDRHGDADYGGFIVMDAVGEVDFGDGKDDISFVREVNPLTEGNNLLKDCQVNIRNTEPQQPLGDGAYSCQEQVTAPRIGSEAGGHDDVTVIGVERRSNYKNDSNLSLNRSTASKVSKIIKNNGFLVGIFCWIT